jgi:hypothetical protein
MRLLWVLVFVAGCAAPNRPPTLVHGPVALGQGQALSVALDPTDAEGDAIEITVTAHPAGLEPTLDGKTLTLRADYTVSGAQQVLLHLNDHLGGETTVPLEVDVASFAWQWTQSVDAMGPTPREHGAFIFDADKDVAYLIGGSGYTPQGTPSADGFWTLDLKTHAFTALPPARTQPPLAASRRVANLPDKKVAYLFGGYTSDSTDVNELWRFDYSGPTPFFTPVSQLNPPPGRELHAFAYDPGTDTFVVFGGYNAQTGLLNDTWTMKLSGDANSASWTQLPGAGPGARYGFFYGMDEAKGQLWVWSGAQRPTASDPINASQELWRLDLRASPPAWVRLMGGSEPGIPTGRRNGAFVFDPSVPRLIVFGGTADGMTTVPGLDVLDLSGSAPQWTQLTLDGAPPMRSSCFGFYDANRQQAVMGFGNDAQVYRDVFGLGY